MDTIYESSKQYLNNILNSNAEIADMRQIFIIVEKLAETAHSEYSNLKKKYIGKSSEFLHDSHMFGLLGCAIANCLDNNPYMLQDIKDEVFKNEYSKSSKNTLRISRKNAHKELVEIPNISNTVDLKEFYNLLKISPYKE